MEAKLSKEAIEELRRAIESAINDGTLGEASDVQLSDVVFNVTIKGAMLPLVEKESGV